MVTGATTPLGQRLVARLAADPRTRAVLAVDAPGRTAPEPPLPRVSYASADLGQHHAARALMLGLAIDLGVDTVVHIPVQDLDGGDVQPSHERDVEATRHLSSLAEEQPRIARFVLRSFPDVYLIERDQPVLIDEDHPLELSAHAAASTRSHVEADLTTCAKIAQSRLHIAVLRCGEILAPGAQSPLYDYLGSRVCLRPLGYDPMLNLLSLADATDALELAAFCQVRGVLNVPGYDTLPLSEVVHLCGRLCVPVPGPWLEPLYGLRARALGARFRYAADRERLHYGAILDGKRARATLGYRPRNPLDLAALFANRGASPDSGLQPDTSGSM
jgi:UDP-glucose 4-epimerase